MGVGNLLRTHEDVERVQDVASTYANVMQGSGRNVIQELGELKNILREQEKAFYRSIGKTREQFLLMYQTADVLISQIDAGLYKPREGILDKYALKTDSQALLNQFANALTTTLAQDNSPLMLETRQESKKIAEAKVVEEIAKTAMQHGGVTFSTKTSRRSSQSKNKQNNRITPQD